MPMISRLLPHLAQLAKKPLSPLSIRPSGLHSTSGQLPPGPTLPDRPSLRISAPLWKKTPTLTSTLLVSGCSGVAGMGETALAILGGLLLADALLPIIIDFMRTNEASQQARGHAKVAAQSFAAGDWLIAAHLFRGAALSVKDQPFMEGKVPNWPHFSSISVAKQKILYSLMTAESFARGGDWRQASSILTETIVNRKRGYRNIDDEWLSLLRVVTRYKGQQPTEYIKDASARIRRAQRGGYKKDLSLELKSWLHNLDATHPGILPKDLQITKNLFYQLEQLNPKSPPTRPPEKFKQIV